AIIVPWDTLITSVVLYIVIPVVLAQLIRKALLAKGVWVIMFPEGTRIPRGERGAYKSGGTRLAVATGAPVIPIAVTSAKCWPRRAFVKFSGVVDVSIGQPIASAGRDADELMHEVENWIEAEMRRLDPDAYQS
ncbi:MAG: hypothetical protein EB125_07785, partial [Betaproteobacteria bacterium]|nr:hypothetical protein [Betaproteobacteria bacterium]